MTYTKTFPVFIEAGLLQSLNTVEMKQQNVKTAKTLKV